MPSQLAEARPARRRRLPGVNLKQGVVKQARLEAGLSLAQLGKGHVTAPAIYLIETGRTRPSLPTLEHIARKTGKTVEFFLADRSGNTDETKTGLIELEARVAEGRFEEAIVLGEQLLNLSSSAHRLGRRRTSRARPDWQDVHRSQHGRPGDRARRRGCQIREPLHRPPRGVARPRLPGPG